MSPRHGDQIDWFAGFLVPELAVLSIVAEAVFNANDDPSEVSKCPDISHRESTHHKLVKTTPKPRATKNKRGELVGLLLPSPPEWPVVVAPGAALVVAEDMT